MKKTLLLLLGIICLFSVSTATVFCVTNTPHIVIEGEVWLLNDAGEKLFMLPNTYYAKILDLDETYYYVTFNGVTGKVSKTTVSTVGYHTVATGTMEELNIADEYAEFESIGIKATPTLSAATSFSLPIGKAFTFIGSYPTAEGTWYYVKYNDLYGYIKQERTTMKELKLADFVPETAPVETVAEPEESTESGNSLLEDKTLRIIIIVGLAIPAVIIVILLFRPSRARRRYDDGD